jgi:glyceraldehyde 3-phosphate dehydrogenase
MDIRVGNKNYLGVNSLGRIGKLVVWHQIAKKQFDGVVVNLGRTVGKSIDDIIQTIEMDTTYGSLRKFLYGMNSSKEIVKVIDKDRLIIELDGMPVKILTSERNPKNIPWKDEDVRVVVDCTGQYVDPTTPFDDPKGSLRGHLVGGAQKVILSAPFKIKDKSSKMPDDSIMMVYGINHLEYNPDKHHIVSAASCTTTGLSHMIKPLLEDKESSKILTTSMSTVHSSTNTQSVLDSVPKANASDLRKNRSVFNNIILSTTGAAKALEAILPQIQEIGFMADSVRIPTNTVSLLVLNITFSAGLDEKGNPIINRKYLNDIFRQAAEGSQKGMLVFSERQNVSSDLAGFNASVVIEGHETHTRTGFINLPAEMFESYGMKNSKNIHLPVTHAKIFGWYDNEYGSYVNTLGALAEYINKKF